VLQNIGGLGLRVAEVFQSEAEIKKCTKEAGDALLRGGWVTPPCGDVITFEPLRPELKVELKRQVDGWAAGDIFLVVDATLPLDWRVRSLMSGQVGWAPADALKRIGKKGVRTAMSMRLG
jgi:hypothetical protein